MLKLPKDMTCFGYNLKVSADDPITQLMQQVSQLTYDVKELRAEINTLK